MTQFDVFEASDRGEHILTMGFPYPFDALAFPYDSDKDHLQQNDSGSISAQVRSWYKEDKEEARALRDGAVK